MLVFGDGSRDAYCAMAYARWPMADGTFKCILVTCKTRVAPHQKITIPRLELLGSLMATRLAKKVVEAFRLTFTEIRFFTDSSVVLGMLQCTSDTFLEFVGVRVAEIKKNSNVQDWC